MDSPSIEDPPPGGLNRRDVLRRGAILGGALIWTVPAVQTLSGPAFAAGSPCIGRFEYANSRGGGFYVQFNSDTTCCDCVTSYVASNGGGGAAMLLAGSHCVIAGECTIQSSGSF